MHTVFVTFFLEIIGAEGTPYEKGIFNLEITIPDR